MKKPSRWVLEQCRAFAPESLVCDIAGGEGRHALPVAVLGHNVVLVDFSEVAVRNAQRRSLKISGVVADVAALPFRAQTFDAVIVTNFLERDLFATFVALLKPGGHLVYETYTTHHAALVAAGLSSAPQNARYLLQPGELRRLVASLTVIDYRETDITDEAGRRACASIHAINS